MFIVRKLKGFRERYQNLALSIKFPRASSNLSFTEPMSRNTWFLKNVTHKGSQLKKRLAKLRITFAVIYIFNEIGVAEKNA